MTKRVLSLVCLTSLLAFACKKEEESSSEQKTETADAGEKPGSAVDPELSKALAAAAPNAPAANANTQGGPPANGVFGPGAADKELAKGAPPKVTIGSEGSEPRVQLLPTLKPDSKVSGSIEIAVQADPRQGALPIELQVSIEAQKPKAAADAPATPAAPMSVVVKVTGAKVNAEGVPADLQTTIAKIKGSRVDYQVLPDGAGTNFRFEPSKGLPPDLNDVVRSLSDALALVTIPYPNKAVGAGAFWMATSRDGVFGLDLVTYRMIKVEKVEGNTVTLSVNTKRYSASPTFDLAGLPPTAPRNLLEFQAVSEGTVQRDAALAIPKSGELNSALVAALGEPGAKQPKASLQLTTRTRLNFGKK